MLIGICGGLCAGKDTLADYLVQQLGFRRAGIGGAYLPCPRQSDQKIFPDFETFLSTVTREWNQQWVLSDITNENVVEKLLQRPFFLLISVDAPVSVRWQRYKSKSVGGKSKSPTLEQFVLQSDEQLYNPNSGLSHVLGRAQMRILNSGNSIRDLQTGLSSLNFRDQGRLRPSWDEYFMQLANLAAQRSNCMKRRVGCVLVREKRVISTGYNGTPRNVRNCNQGGCPRCNGAERAGAGLATCLCLHAEENALLEAGRERIREGAILYCNTCPCLTCSVKIAQVGITEVIFSQSYNLDQSAAAVLGEAGVKLRQFSPPRKGLIDLYNMDTESGSTADTVSGAQPKVMVGVSLPLASFK